LPIARQNWLFPPPFPFHSLSSRAIGRSRGRESVNEFYLTFVMGCFIETFHLDATHRDNMSSSLGRQAAGAASDHSVRPT